jgi:hypothetical protein
VLRYEWPQHSALMLLASNKCLPPVDPLFLITLPRTSKSHEIFKLMSLFHIAVRVEAHNVQTGLTQCYNCQQLTNCKQPFRCVWCGAVTCTRNAWKRAIQHRYGHAATATIEATGTPWTRCERQSRRERPRPPAQDYPSRRRYAAASAAPQLHRPALQPLRHNKRVPIQAPNVNSSSLNMFTVVATIFQQIMTEVNGAGSEGSSQKL